VHDPVTLAQRLVRMDTRGGGEKAAAELLAELLDEAGFDTALSEPEAGRANLVARYGSGTPVTLTGHLDTVPADPSGWSFPPLSGDIDGDVDGGLLRGRGSTDMKAGVASLAVAAVRSARRSPDGTDVQLVFTFGEETGCEGAAQLADLAPSPALIVAEPTANQLVLGHKGALWLRLTATGRSAHGSRPELGDNALVKLATSAARLHDPGRWPQSPTHGPATVNVGTFRSGVQPNLVPDHAELTLDVRTVPEFTAEQAVAEIRRLLPADVTVERLLDLPGVATGADDALVRGVARALRPDEPDWRPQYATYFTDASVLRERLGGPAVVVYGPGDPGQAHAADETCPVAAIRESADAIGRLLCAWPELSGGR